MVYFIFDVAMGLSLRDLLLGLIGTAIAVISMSIVIKLIWNAWGSLIEFLVSIGFQPEIEYVIGIFLFIIAVWLGLVQLKKIEIKRK